MSRKPRVSVVIPARNEGQHLATAVHSVLTQTVPDDELELVIVVASSDDATCDVARLLAEHSDRVRVVSCESGRTPVVLNCGISAARGEIIVRVDAHGAVEPEYVAEAVGVLERTGAAAVGGVVEFTGRGRTGTAVAWAMNSRLGAGTAAFRSTTVETEADTLMWGVYPRDLFKNVGLFDEGLLRNQDDELCYRIRQAGGTLIVSPTMRFRQAARDSLRGLYRQYFEWGSFRVMTLAKHGRFATARQMLPPALVLVLGAGVAWDISTGSRWGRRLMAAYGGAALAAGAEVAVGRGQPRLFAHVGAAIAAMQLAYGAGFLAESVTGRVRRTNRTMDTVTPTLAASSTVAECETHDTADQ